MYLVQQLLNKYCQRRQFNLVRFGLWAECVYGPFRQISGHREKEFDLSFELFVVDKQVILIPTRPGAKHKHTRLSGPFLLLRDPQGFAKRNRDRPETSINRSCPVAAPLSLETVYQIIPHLAAHIVVTRICSDYYFLNEIEYDPFKQIIIFKIILSIY